MVVLKENNIQWNRAPLKSGKLSGHLIMSQLQSNCSSHEMRTPWCSLGRVFILEGFHYVVTLCTDLFPASYNVAIIVVQVIVVPWLSRVYVICTEYIQLYGPSLKPGPDRTGPNRKSDENVMSIIARRPRIDASTSRLPHVWSEVGVI